jgi:hypothetical protein
MLPFAPLRVGLVQSLRGLTLELRRLGEESVRQLANAAPARGRAEPHFFTVTLGENLSSVADWYALLVFLLPWEFFHFTPAYRPQRPRQKSSARQATTKSPEHLYKSPGNAGTS